MRTLSSSAFQSAREYLETRARPIELARFLYSFGNGSAKTVLAELERFRNSDGGFGHALEPDNRAQGSSVLATTEALAIIGEIGSEHDQPAVAGALAWLLSRGSGFDSEHLIWPYLPQGLDVAHHAPWWTMDTLSRTFEGFVVNPRARILAYFWTWPGFADSEHTDLIAAATEAVITWCESAPDETSPDTLRSLVMLADAPHLPTSSRETLVPRVHRMIPASVETDPDKWGDYGLQPTEVAESPDSPWLPVLGSAVDAHLDHIVTSQEADGSWKPFWNWGGMFPETWEVAKTEWAGVLTLRHLRVLERFGRL